MRIAFYAPLKPPDHPVPSGDRRVAGLLIEALERGGHEVCLASRLRSRDAVGDPARQARLAALGARYARRIVARCRAGPAERRPDLWLTYHLYYKAADWIGPRVARALGIPYVVAEASVASKRAGGPWDAGHRATLAALSQARLVLALNPADVAGLPPGLPLRVLPPFLDAAPFLAAAAARAGERAGLAGRLGLDPALPWIAVVAMMRDGDKLASYRLLGEALARLGERPWCLLVAGDGPAREAVQAALAAVPEARKRFLGVLAPEALPALYAACDLMAWPAVNEAYGMALLEAQAAGLPVVAGRVGGVSAVVEHGVGGLLSQPGEPAALAAAIARLLNDPAGRRRMAEAAMARVRARHDLPAATASLERLLGEALDRL